MGVVLEGDDVLSHGTNPQKDCEDPQRVSALLLLLTIYIMTEKACILEYRPYRPKGQVSRV